MLRGFSIFLFIILASASVSASEITEIPLPELHGSYFFNFHNETTIQNVLFEFDTAPTTIYDVRIKLSGIVDAGHYICDPYPVPIWWGIEFKTFIDDSVTGGYWHAYAATPRHDGSFELEEEFTPHSQATWEFLKSCTGGGRVIIRPELASFGLSCYHHIYPSVVVEEAFLVIEADIKVAIENYTWSSIKAQYSQ